ncbi:MAG TPA: TonB-dependent receptor [Thermoanaerobaculia bacterium]|nr:TonB-dependent receptor [Thermoanaerobaculia bacterium]
MKNLVSLLTALAATVALMPPAIGQTAVPAPATTTASTGAATKQSEEAKSDQLRQQGEGLIYSVARTPERTFDASRAVEVITGDEIRRRNGITLGDLLQEEAGVTLAAPHAGGAAVVIRGLSGNQVMLMIDGVKVNDAIWHAASASKEQLNLIDVSMIERIEVVRGVVSVLGTESLGGVVNIITRRGPDSNTTVGGSIGTRFASGDHSIGIPLQLFGQNEKLRYTVGGTYFNGGNVRAGGDVGTQKFTDYKSNALHGSIDYFLSADKTISAGYQSSNESDIQRNGLVQAGTNIRSDVTPNTLQLGQASYQDLTSRGWEQSFRLTGYWNRQQDGTDAITAKAPTLDSVARNIDRMTGLNLELGSFPGAHHLLYGVDFSSERVHSLQSSIDMKTGIETASRGRYIDGSGYSTLGVYLNDHFDVTKWVTATVGARYGKFTSKGSEITPLVGPLTIDSSKSDVTGAVNVVVHATSHLNLIANAMRGFRAPNLDDMSVYRVTASTGIDIPSAGLDPEHVMSYELGAKYENAIVSGSAFFFQNSFTNLVTRGLGYYNGLSFVDTNKNGVQDKNELTLHQNSNVGSEKMTGYEIEVRTHLTTALQLFGNYAHLTSDVKTDPTLYTKILPKSGVFGARYSADIAFNPWGEVVMRYGSRVVSGLPVAGYHVFTVRTGASVTPKFSVTAAVENITNERYTFLGTQSSPSLFAPGRQLVIGTQYRF